MLAIKNACSKLDLSIEDLKYDVISEGTSGIFGIVGRKNAKIKVVLPDEDLDKSAQIQSEGVQSIVDEAFGKETRVVQPVEKLQIVDVTQESIDLGAEALQKMADLITDDAKVSSATKNDRLTLSIEGGNTGILIGRKGQTLDAMQFLTDKIINRKSDAQGKSQGGH